MATTMTHIAKEAGVSVALVSRLLRHDRSLKVTDATRERVLATCHRLGGVQSLPWTRVRPCHVALPLNRIYAHLDTQWTANHPVIRHFEQHLQAQGGRMSIVFFDESERICMLRQLIEDPNYCEALLLCRGVTDQALEDLLHKHRFPHICLDAQASRYHVNTVFADEMGGMRQVVHHLKELGHQRIGYVGPRSSRYPVFVAALLEAGLSLRQQAICELTVPTHLRDDAAAWRREAETKFRQWIRTPSALRCTAVHCHNDDMALGVIDAMQSLGMVPGRDLSVIGYDNIAQRSATPSNSPCLTTIDNPLEETGRRAADRLLAQFHRKESQIIHERIPTRLVVRKTTASPTPVSDRATTSSRHA